MNQLTHFLAGIGPLMPEPEVVQSTLAKARNLSLARIICALINENEPLLKAEVDGTSITVRERGGGAVMAVTVGCPAERQAKRPEGARRA